MRGRSSYTRTTTVGSRPDDNISVHRKTTTRAQSDSGGVGITMWQKGHFMHDCPKIKQTVVISDAPIKLIGISITMHGQIVHGLVDT